MIGTHQEEDDSSTLLHFISRIDNFEPIKSFDFTPDFGTFYFVTQHLSVAFACKKRRMVMQNVYYLLIPIIKKFIQPEVCNN